MAQPEFGSTHKELAYSILVLEQQLKAYRRLHEEEMAAMHQVLDEIKARILEVGQHQNATTLFSEDAGR